MKKILVLCLAAVLSLALVGCNNNNDVVNNDNLQVEDNQNQENENLGNAEDYNNMGNEENPGEEVESGNIENELPGEVSGEVSEENDEPVEEYPEENEMEQSEIAKKISSIMEKGEIMVNAPFTVDITSEMSEMYIGLSEDDFNANVLEAACYESMMMPSNQSFCLVKVKDTSKVEDLKQKIFDNCNPRKWICMTADRVIVLNSGEYIMLAMASQESCNALIPTFEAEFGKENIGTILDKTVSESIEDFEGLPGADGGMAL